MEIKPTQLDMTNPFALLQQRVNQVDTVLLQMPPALREQLLAEMLPPMPMHRPSPPIEQAVTMVTVKVEEWDGGSVVQRAASTPVLRPRRIARHIPWQWRLIVIGIRLGRRLRRVARKQWRQMLKASRRFIRRVLPRHKAMRGARAR